MGAQAPRLLVFNRRPFDGQGSSIEFRQARRLRSHLLRIPGEVTDAFEQSVNFLFGRVAGAAYTEQALIDLAESFNDRLGVEISVGCEEAEFDEVPGYFNRGDFFVCE